MNEDNHFSWLLTCYDVSTGMILHRYSGKTQQQVEDFAKLIKGAGDIIIQKVEHWNIIP